MTATWLQDLREPIISAPMAGASGGRLAGAVTAAGGLGMIGVGAAATSDFVIDECTVARGAAVDSPGGAAFGVGLMLWALEERPELLEVTLEQRPTLISLSFGDPARLVPRARDAGATVCAQVGTVEEARRALDAGVDLLVARGSEGGGHGRAEVSTLPLLQQVLEISDRPVVAAGGIGTARGVAAVLAAGAVAAWVGTPFAACAESDFTDQAKEAVITADAADTVYTRTFDIALRQSWPEIYGGRLIANAFSREWAPRVDQLQELVASGGDIPDQVRRAHAAGDVSVAPVYAGQSAGLVHGPRTAADVVSALSGFREYLAAAQRWV